VHVISLSHSLSLTLTASIHPSLPRPSPPPPFFHSAQKEATLAHVVKMLLATGFHHLWVTDSDLHLVGLVSFTDIFRQLCVEV